MTRALLFSFSNDSNPFAALQRSLLSCEQFSVWLVEAQFFVWHVNRLWLSLAGSGCLEDDVMMCLLLY